MALNKSIMTEFGVDAIYWNVGVINEKYKEKVVEVLLFGYASEEARQNNNQMVTATVVFGEGEYTPDVTRDQVYALIKNKFEFEGATDC